MNFVICKRNRLQTYLLTNLIINLMVLVDKENVFDKYVRNINSSITVWDVYVAINAQYHDYVRLYSEWFRNINKNELDNKIIESAITFYFKDEDSGSTKTWNYFKTAN